MLTVAVVHAGDMAVDNVDAVVVITSDSVSCVDVVTTTLGGALVTADVPVKQPTTHTHTIHTKAMLTFKMRYMSAPAVLENTYFTFFQI